MRSDRFHWLTPPGPAAIALLTMPALAKAFDRPLPAIGAARFARLIDPGGKSVDEVVVTRVREDLCEISCHGGSGIHAAIQQCLASHGLAAQAEPVGDPLWLALAGAPSPAATTWLLRHQLATPPFAADFLTRKPVVLIAGPTNAGKSTLLNAWCGHPRALVSDQPGTTRDLVTADALIHGWRIQLVDSAGSRATADPIETAGQELVANARTFADLVLYLAPVDAPSAPIRGDLVVDGKADLAVKAGALSWSARGDDSQRLLDQLGRAVLDRLGLPILV